jgi:pseudouridine synthase
MPVERLQKIIARAGIASRRSAEVLIQEGRVSVNQHVIRRLGTCADPHRDSIHVDGKLLGKPPAFIYLLMYKPRGVISTLQDPEGRTTIWDLLQDTRWSEERLFPVGRLDYHAEGLLPLTNDGALTHHLLHPAHHVAKTYLVKIQGKISDEALQHLREGVDLRDEDSHWVGRSAPAEVYRHRTVQANTWLEMTLFEGKNHQIRRMCQAVGHFCLRILRIGFGGLELGTLSPGQIRALYAHEKQQLLEHQRFARQEVR